MNFIPETTILLQFIAATIVLAITPGPDMTLFVSRTLSQGRIAGFATAMGTYCGVVVHTTLVVVGISALIVASPQAFLALKIFGAGYLLYLAWQAIRHGSAFSPKTTSGGDRSLLRNWANGFWVNLLNPKVILFYMTFLPLFVSAHDPDAPAKLLFLGLLSIAVSIPITAPMIFAADRFAAMMKKSPRVTRIVDYLLAGLFSAFAIKILSAQAK